MNAGKLLGEAPPKLFGFTPFVPYPRPDSTRLAIPDSPPKGASEAQRLSGFGPESVGRPLVA